jgi:hypothetical protein
VVKLYVEGGGDSGALKTECRKGFTQFITKAGIVKRPRVIACGSRRDAYESYCTAIQNGDAAFLLVDSEEPIDASNQNGKPDEWTPWRHLKNRAGDNWDKPHTVADTDCHLMTQVMESWFIADRKALKNFFGAEFKEDKLPPAKSPTEDLRKKAIYDSLRDSTRLCKNKGEYGKGSHSFKILSDIDPISVTTASPWAKRFIDELKKKMDP